MLLAFNIILDDIVFPDGRTTMGLLGGGGPQAAFGMRLFAERVGLAAEVGRDLPPSAWAWMTDSGIETAGVRVNQAGRTPRAWQVTDDDGRRTQVWRTRPSSPVAVETLLQSYRQPTGAHLGVHPDSPPTPLAAGLRKRGAVLSVEMYRPAAERPRPEALRALLSLGDIFSANLREGQSLVGAASPRGVLRRLIEAAESRALLMVLRLGEKGSLVAEGQTGQVLEAPAVPTAALNVVGAGNAYCGGFLAGWLASHSLHRAAACGAVAASLIVEHVGLPVVTEALRAEAGQRLAAVEPKIEYTSL